MCKCKKNACSSKKCSCFQSRHRCNDLCRCSNCLNHVKIRKVVKSTVENKDSLNEDVSLDDDLFQSMLDELLN